jgi:hypothetical protein
VAATAATRPYARIRFLPSMIGRRQPIDARDERIARSGGDRGGIGASRAPIN